MLVKKKSLKYVIKNKRKNKNKKSNILRKEIKKY